MLEDMRQSRDEGGFGQRVQIIQRDTPGHHLAFP
jgi:hypothetical protein